MNKSELVELLAKKEGLTLNKAEQIVNIFFDSIAEGLAKGERAEIRSFASFKVKEYKGYQGRNPKTGEIVDVTPKKLPFFKAGSELKKRVDFEDTE